MFSSVIRSRCQAPLNRLGICIKLQLEMDVTGYTLLGTMWYFPRLVINIHLNALNAVNIQLIQ